MDPTDQAPPTPPHSQAAADFIAALTPPPKLASIDEKPLLNALIQFGTTVLTAGSAKAFVAKALKVQSSAQISHVLSGFEWAFQALMWEISDQLNQQGGKQ